MRTTVILFISLCFVILVPCVSDAQDSTVRGSFRFHEASLRASLDSLMKWFPVSIVYLDRDVEGKVVSAFCTDCSFERALESILAGTSLSWIRYGNQVILRERETPQERQLATISGTLKDSLTGDWIAGASVMLQDTAAPSYEKFRCWCPTNSYGFFSLRHIPLGGYSLVVRALGYRTATFRLDIVTHASVKLDIGLMQEDIALQEVTVEGSRAVLTSAEGISRGVYIRSAPSDQNQYLLDGAHIYNPAHYGGILTTFNTDVLNDVQVVVGGLPPYYGGGIGGIFDLAVRDGIVERFAGTAGMGSLGAHLSIEAPLDDNTNLLVSGRRGYPDAAVLFLKGQGTPSRLGSSEVIAKLNRRLSGSSRLSLSGFVGRDSYSNEIEGNGMRLNNNLSWGNSMLTLRWIGIASPSLFLQTSAVYTKYEFTLEHLLTGDPLLPARSRLSSEYAIEDVTVRAHAEHYYDQEHTMRAGVELIHHQMVGEISEFSSQNAPLSLQGFSAWELSVYVQDQWRVLPRVTAELGARATSFSGHNGSFSAVDPRFSLLVSLDEHTRVYSSLTAINQFIHPYRNSGVFLFYPTVFWYPSTEHIRPSTSVQLTLGVEKSMKEDAYVLSAESYYRNTQNLHEFGLDTASISTGDLGNAIMFGTGRVYGGELSLRKRTGDLRGSISYALSWSSETFAELNDGKPFAPRFDRRHEVHIASSYTAGPEWTFGVLLVLASDQSPSFAPRIITRNAVFEPSGADINDLNGGRIPGFQRLELNVTHGFTLWNLSFQLSLRLLNSYGLLDPFVWELTGNPDLRLKWKARLQQLNLFPLFPALGFKVRF